MNEAKQQLMRPILGAVSPGNIIKYIIGHPSLTNHSKGFMDLWRKLEFEYGIMGVWVFLQ
jgi:hypothetical protein